MKLIIRFAKPYWKLCLLILMLLVFDVAGALYIPTLAAELLNQGIAGSTPHDLIRTGIMMAAVSIISSGAALLSAYACAKFSAKIGKDMRDAIYQKSLTLSMQDFNAFGTASMTTRTIADVTNIQLALVSFIQMVLPVPIIAVIALTLAFRLDQQAAWLLLAVVGFVLIVAGIIMKFAAPLSRALQKKLDKMSAVFLENITGVRVIRAFNREKSEESRLNGRFSSYAGTAIKTNKMFANLDGLSFFAVNIFIIIVYWTSGFRIELGHFQIGDITAIIEYALLILFFLMMAQMVILTLPRALQCCHRISEILDYQVEIKDNPPKNFDSEPTATKEVLRFDHVTFQYSDAEASTLNDLTFTCKRGETTAIIGGTGSGKSTLASLILRFHDVTRGAIYLEGQPITEFSQAQLRDHIGYIQQKAWLFSGTILENLRLGNAELSEQDAEHALTIAQAGSFVNSLPDKMNARVAQGGGNFSGGQKQRLSIARGLAKKAPLYIFDDSFSALDFKTDAQLRQALAAEMSESALLIIAQRISSIKNAEQIIVIDEGKIVGIGRHEQLLKTCRIYQEINASQTKEGEQVG